MAGEPPGLAAEISRFLLEEPGPCDCRFERVRPKHLRLEPINGHGERSSGPRNRHSRYCSQASFACQAPLLFPNHLQL